MIVLSVTPSTYVPTKPNVVPPSVSSSLVPTISVHWLGCSHLGIMCSVVSGGLVCLFLALLEYL